MSSEVLNSLLREYEKNKLNAEFDLEKRKEALYKKLPKLQEIEVELNSTGIAVNKNILLNNLSSLEELKAKIEQLKFQKACILHDANISDDYLKPHYKCSICSDTGYVLKDNYKTEMCTCLKQRLLDISFNKSNISNLDKENFDTFNLNFFSDEIDVAKYHLNISPRKNIQNIKNKCVEFVQNFDDPKCKNLLFSGNTGLR